MIHALGLHNHNERTATLNSLFAREDWQSQRPAILASLALQQATPVETMLLRVAGDNSAANAERRVALRALVRYSEAALAVLVRMSAEDAAMEFRETAVKSLGYFAATRVEETLQQLAWFDARAGLREAAVESLADLNLRSAQEELLAIARNHPRACSHYLKPHSRSQFSAWQGPKERCVVPLHERLRTPPGGKLARPFGLWLKKRHSALLVVHLDSPNFSPRALIGAFSDTTVRFQIV